VEVAADDEEEVRASSSAVERGIEPRITT